MPRKIRQLLLEFQAMRFNWQTGNLMSPKQLCIWTVGQMDRWTVPPTEPNDPLKQKRFACQGAAQSSLNICNAHKVFATFAAFITFVAFTAQSVSNIHFYWGCFYCFYCLLALWPTANRVRGSSVSVSLWVCAGNTQHAACNMQQSPCWRWHCQRVGHSRTMRGCIISACIYSRLRYRCKEREGEKGKGKEREWRSWRRTASLMLNTLYIEST